MMRFVAVFLIAAFVNGAVPEETEDHHEEEFTPEMLLEQTRDDFNNMDSNHDGFLCFDDIMLYLDDETAIDEVMDFIVKADLDGDDRVSFEEYHAFVMELFAQYSQESTGNEYDDFDFSQFEGMEGFDDLDDLDDETHHDGEEL